MNNKKEENESTIAANKIAAKYDSTLHKDTQDKRALIGETNTGNHLQFQFNTDEGVSITNLPEDSTHTIAVDKQSSWHYFFDYNKIKKHHPDVGGYIKEEVSHLYPKVFFFLIPCMALLLKILFFRRRDLLYVDHVIFSLHFHALWFSLRWLVALYPFVENSGIVSFIAFICAAVYMVLALKNVYHIKTGRSLLYTTFIAISYFILLTVALFALFLIILALA